MRKRIALGVCLLLAALLLAGCKSTQKATLTIAEQFGIAYAPLQIMKEVTGMRCLLESASRKPSVPSSPSSKVSTTLLAGRLCLPSMNACTSGKEG